MAEAVPDQVQLALDKGELLRAYDHAQVRLAGQPGAARLVYQRSLALARMGDAAGALASLAGLPPTEDAGEDVLALRGRILKDLALQSSGDARRDLFGQASDAYHDAHVRGGGQGFALVNAATCALLGGELDLARNRAREVLGIATLVAAHDFYAAATIGEALVLLGAYGDAAVCFDGALGMPDATPDKRAAAARQLDGLAAATGAPEIAALAAVVRPPPVAFFAGPMFHADPSMEARLAAAIDGVLDAAGVAVAFGGVAAGADILFGEAIVRRGGELNLVLPFATDDYLAQSVRPWGAAWLPRAKALLAAGRVSHVSDGGFVDDPGQFGYGSEVAMGLASLRARHLCTDAIQLAVVDPAGDRGPSGSMSGIAAWRATGRAVETIEAGPIDRRRAAHPATAAVGVRRETRSIIFTDYAGFSKLGEAAIPRFVERVMGDVALVLDRHRDAVLFRDSWGDAMFAVVRDPLAAADIALALQEALAAVEPDNLARPAEVGMRVSLHHGPMYRLDDPVTGRPGFFGTEVTRAARIEPITPVGQVYATETFAALLALHGDERFALCYAGVLPLAKGYGAMPMHRLTRRHRAPAPSAR